MSTKDFKARQIRTNQVINSGSSLTSPLLIYGLGSATNDSGGFTAANFVTGSNTWLYISGAIDSALPGSTNYGTVTFGGDVQISGTLYGGNISGSGSPGGSITQVQFHDGASFGGDSALTWKKLPNILTLSGTLLTTGSAQFASGYGSSGVTIFDNGDIFTDGELKVEGITTLKGDMIFGNSVTDTIAFNAHVTSSIVPTHNVTWNLGSPILRWANIYTGDLHLQNDRGDWTIVEEEDFLCVVNNKSGKKFKMMLEPID